MGRKWIGGVVAVLLAVGLLGALPAPVARAATTYTWNQTGSASWAVATNWTPARNTPAADDILIVDGSVTASPTLTNVPTQTIGQLRIINNANATFTATASATLTIAGGTGTDFEIASGSSLTLSGSNAIQISLSTGATGSISGAMTVTGAAHRLTAADALGITFNSGASFTTETGFSGNAFGAGTANSVIFSSGATYTHNAGANPFGLAAPSSVVVFQPGSTAVYRTTTGYSASGRTYANLTVQNNTALSGSGAGDFQFQNLVVEAGSSFSHTGSGAAAVTIKGDITTSGTGNVTITSGTGGIQVNGGVIQIFGGGGGTGSITFGSALTVASGTTLAAARTLTTNGSVTINGAFQLNPGGWATGSGTWTYGANATLVFNSSGSYGVNNTDVFWPTTGGPQNVTVQGGGLTMNSGASRTVNGLFQTAATVTNAHQLTLNGTAQLNAGGWFASSPVYGSNATLVYNTGGTYNISNEWTSGSSPGSGVPKNVTIQNNTAVVLPTGAGTRTVPGNFTLTSGSLTLGGNIGDDLVVKGDWINNGGTFNANNRAVTFDGSSAQTIGGTSSTTFDYLTINNSSPDSAGITLGIGQTVNGALTLTDGLVKIGGHNLTLGPNATVSGGSVGSMIVTDTDGSATGDGFVCKQYTSGTYNPAAFTFPVGDYYGTTQYSPAVLDFGSSTFGSNAQVCVRVTNAQHPNWPGSDYPTYINRYWTVTQSNITSFTCDTTFTYREDGAGDDVVIGSGQSEAALYHKIWNGSSWTTGNQANTTANTFGTTVSSFSDHTAFSGSPLAVSLAAFTAEAAPDGVALSWETVSEADNVGFRVWRSEAADGERTLLAFVPAAAPGSMAGGTYRYVDATARPGRVYWYWLEDVDLSGATTLHGPVSAQAAPVGRSRRLWLPLVN